MLGSGTFKFFPLKEENNVRYSTVQKSFQSYPTNQSSQYYYNSNARFLKPTTISSTNFRKNINYSMNFNNIQKNSDYYSTKNQSNFPLSEITNTDFESILTYGDLTKIDKLLPQMIYNDLSFSKNPHLILVLQNYQNILKFLFNQQANIISKNNIIENFVNNDNSDINKHTKKLEDAKINSNRLLKAYNNQKKKLQNRINLCKSILISNGYKDMIPYNLLININDNEGIYRCEICPDKTFKSYEHIHAHYIKNHFNRENNNLIFSSNNINKFYFDNQLNIIKNELKNTMIELNQKFDNDYKDRKCDNLRREIETQINYNEEIENNLIKTNKNYSTSNLMKINSLVERNNFESNDLNEQLRNIEREQKLQYQKLQNNFENLKNEIFNELKNFSKNEIVVNNNFDNVKNNKNVSYMNYETNNKKINDNYKNTSTNFEINNKNINDNYKNINTNFEINNKNINDDNKKILNDEKSNVRQDTQFTLGSNQNAQQSNKYIPQNNNMNINENININNNSNDINDNKELKSTEELKEQIRSNPNIKNNDINSIIKSFRERDNKILFGDSYDLNATLNNYNFLNIRPSKTEFDKITNMINKKNDYYKLNKSDLSGEDYSNFISKIISDNKDSKYFNNIYKKSKISSDEFQPQKKEEAKKKKIEEQEKEEAKKKKIEEQKKEEAIKKKIEEKKKEEAKKKKIGGKKKDLFDELGGEEFDGGNGEYDNLEV